MYKSENTIEHSITTSLLLFLHLARERKFDGEEHFKYILVESIMRAKYGCLFEWKKRLLVSNWDRIFIRGLATVVQCSQDT